MNETSKKRFIVAVSGASGAMYAERFIEVLLPHVSRIYLLLSDTAKDIIQHELEASSILVQAGQGKLSEDHKKTIRCFEQKNLFAPIASGTDAADAMVILPCSMGMLARVAHGTSSNLIERSADVMLKQRRKLIICPREMPLSLLHLRNMVAVTEAGAEMLPLMPGFYFNPKDISELIDFCVGHILEQLGIKHDLYKPWNSRLR